MVARVLVKVANYKIRLVKKLKQHYNTDVFNMHDDYGSGDRMFMSADMWRKLIKPHLQRIIDAAHESGLLYQHHSCGDIEMIQAKLGKAGVSIIS